MATVEMTDGNFQDLIKNSKTLVVDSWAAWCAPCRKSTPIFEQMSEKISSDDFVFAKLDTQHHQEAAGFFKILSLPTFLVFRDGDLVNRWTGADIGKLRKEITALTE